MSFDQRFLQHAGVQVPVVCGAMYPCSNPELVAAVSAAGGLGIVQPISLTFVHGHEFRAGLRFMRSRTERPFGVNVIVEQSNQTYLKRMQRYVEVSLEEGVRFFITSLGNPKWVVDQVAAHGGVVYHDVTEHKWAQKAVDVGVKGLIAVNRNAGGHAGRQGQAELFCALQTFGLPVLAAGGIGDAAGMCAALREGYAGVQMGTRFIATTECSAHADYKAAIVAAQGGDIVLTERISGVPVAVINTPYIQRLGTKANPLSRWLLRHPRTKHYMRQFYTLRSVYKLKRSLHRAAQSNDYWQAGQSVSTIDAVEPVANVLGRFAAAAREV